MFVDGSIPSCHKFGGTMSDFCACPGCGIEVSIFVGACVPCKIKLLKLEVARLQELPETHNMKHQIMMLLDELSELEDLCTN
jgi:hypothetical protein